MPDLPDHIRARRAAAATARRRRRLGIGAFVSGIVALAAAVLLLTGAGGGTVRAVASRRVTTRRAGAGSTGSGRPATAGGLATAGLAALEARGTATIRRLAALGLPVYCAGPRGDAVAFTFDDGPGPYTHFALKKLAAAHERATFFVVGRSMTNFPGLVERETALAAIGDHTMTHPVLPGLTASAVTTEMSRAQAMIRSAIDRPVVLFRPPYGAHNASVDATARRLGMLEILWSVDSRDSLGARWAGIIRNVEAGLHPGAIILMHENRGQTIRALTTVLPALHRRHLRSVSLPELFAIDAPSVAQLRRGEAACGARSAPVRTGN